MESDGEAAGLMRETVAYSDGGVRMLATAIHDAATEGRRPGVLVAHAWAGQGEGEIDAAAALARLGYVGFAVDLFGERRTGSGPEENARLIQPFLDDRSLLQRRMSLAADALRAHDRAAGRVAAIGYCFGGLAALELARSGADVAGVVSFHGLLPAADPRHARPRRAEVLVLHGFRDPLAPPDHLERLCRELDAGDAGWSVRIYGRAAHAFTNPRAAAPEQGIVYDREAAESSWREATAFLARVLAR